MIDVIHLRPSNFVGGPERQILRYAGHEQNGLYRLAIASFCDGHEGRELLAEADRQRLETIALPGGAVRDLAGLTTLIDRIRQDGVRLLCTHGYRADLIGLLAARRCGIPVVFFLRGWTGENPKIRVYEALDRALLGRADRIVCLSHLQADRVAALGVPRQNIRIVPNAVPPPASERVPARAEVCRRLGVPDDAILVGAAGRLSPEKGATDLIQAVRLMGDSARRARFLIFGDGPLRGQLEDQIRQAGLGDTIILGGFHPDFPQLLPGLDLLVNPSHREEMPNVVMEAMAAAVPVVATAVGGVAEIAGPEKAIQMVSSGQPARLAGAIAELLAQPRRRHELAQAGQQRIASAYSLERQRQCLRDLYRETAGAPAAPEPVADPAASLLGEEPAAARLPMVSVVVPVRNERDHLPAVLDQLLAQDYPPERMEILVADGMSTDGTDQVIARYQRESGGRVRGIANPALRSSAGRNQGMRHSRGEWVLFVDGHCHLPSATMIRDLVEETARHGAECISRPQPLTAPGASRLQRCIAAVRATAIAHGADSTIFTDDEGAWVNPASSGAGYSRRVLGAVGEYDESFDACEDVEFNWRVYEAGFNAWLSRKFTVEYQARASLTGLWRQMMRYGRGRVRLARKHRRATSLAQWVPAVWLAGLVLGAALFLFSSVVAWLLAAALLLYAVVVLGFSLRLGLRHGAYFLCTAPLVYFTVHAGLGMGAWRELLAGNHHRPLPFQEPRVKGAAAPGTEKSR